MSQQSNNRINHNNSQNFTIPYNTYLYALINDEVVTIQEIADIWDVKISTVYNVLEHRTKVTPERINVLWRKLKRACVLNYFLKDSGFVLHHIPEALSHDSLTNKSLEIAESTGLLMGIVKEVIKDNKLTKDEKELIQNHLERIEKQVAELYSQVKQ